jgi:hypothetical protein
MQGDFDLYGGFPTPSMVAGEDSQSKYTLPAVGFGWKLERKVDFDSF